MKKILATLMALTAAASFGATEKYQPSLVYDFSASIKRIEPTYSVQTYNGIETVAFKYNVVSDTLKGFIGLPYCENCVDTTLMESVTTMNEGKGAIILVREGDKFGTFIDGSHKKAMLDPNMKFYSAIFGANVPQNYLAGIGPQTIKDCKYAWLQISFSTPDLEIENLPVGEVLPRFAGATDPQGNLIKLYYGFLGLNNVEGGNYDAAGFGEASTEVFSTPDTTGWCGKTDGTSSECTVIKSIEGSIIADPVYGGSCGVQAMWDVCVVRNIRGKNDNAIVCGTWKISLNKDLTSVSILPAQLDAKICKALNITEDDVEVLEDEKVEEVEEIAPAIN